MNLVIDIGNSSVKFGVFKNEEKILVSKVEKLAYPLLSEIIEKNNVKRIIYSSVQSGQSEFHTLLLKTGLYLHQLSYKSKLPFKICYQTPETLGQDRIAGMAFAYNNFKDQNVLLIDAGTAVTYDVLTQEGLHEGGNISPGLKMRFKALHEFTGNLPLVSPQHNNKIVGDNTIEAIRAGVQQGLIFEINEYIRNFENRYKNLNIIVTGGDGKFLTERIKQTVTFVPDLIIEGLNYILNYNA